MRIAFLVPRLDGVGGTARATVSLANALAPHQEVRIVSVARSADAPTYDVDRAVAVDHLVDLRDRQRPRPVAEELATPAEAAVLHRQESALARTDARLSALTDLALAALLPTLDVDVVVPATPGLMAAALAVLDDRVLVVHMEHGSPGDRPRDLETLLAHAPRADAVVLPTAAYERWLAERLGPLCPPTEVLPQPLTPGFHPRSALDNPLVMAAGRLVPEKQYPLLVTAFARVADQLPEWRLRICGAGPARHDLVPEIRKWGLWDRVELPGAVADMPAEWARASVAALTSRVEGTPLALQEAMAAGVPVVAFDAPTGPREVVEHDRNGLLVAPQSVAGMSAALLRLATDVDLRSRLGREALRTARRYDAAALAERWVGVLSEARARRAGRDRVTAGVGGRAASAAGRRRDPGTDGSAATDVTPAQARTAALRLATEAARATGADWLVIPPHERDTPVLVLPTSARDRFLETLAAADAPPYLSLRDPELSGWPERRGRVADLATELRRGMTGVVCLEPWPEGHLGQGGTVEVQFWERSVEGDLVGPRRNPYAERLPARPELVDVVVDGVTVPTVPLMAAPTAGECRFPVDVVYTWVDGSDPEWNARREQRLAGVTGTAQTRAASGQARFVEHDELRYSFRSIHLFAPWVRRIHLVTDRQVPAWLDPDHPMVHLVDHRDILPADALPTFNSHAIETALHRIDGLAEHFVYLNDDVLLGRPLRPEAFFSPSGSIAVFPSRMTIGLDDAPDAPPFQKAAWNNRRLLHDELGAVITHHLAHTPHPHRVSVLEELTERFADAVAGTARAPFRSDTDVSVLSSLAQHYALLTGRAHAVEPSLAFVNLSNADVEWQLGQALLRDQDFICLADHHDHALPAAELDRLLAEFYVEYYPVAAPWER